jgi:hypothetical protein
LSARAEIRRRRHRACSINGRLKEAGFGPVISFVPAIST